MYEVEVKVRADHAGVRERLAERGADHLGAVRQVDTYYDAPHREFAETDEALRVRRERSTVTGRTAASEGTSGTERTPDSKQSGSDEATTDEDRVVLTYKGPLLETESKSREEHETAVSDPEAIGRILRATGFEPAATVEKERDRYALEGYTVTLDRVDGLGAFVEVETETGDDDIAGARDGARALVESLGLDPAEQIRTSYLGLLLESAGGDSQQ